jgi:hypothetical protein
MATTNVDKGSALSFVGVSLTFVVQMCTVRTTVAVIGLKKTYPAKAGLSVEPMNSSFAGKAGLIAGGTFGVGFPRAVAFAEQGGNITVAWRREIEEADSFRLVVEGR